MEKDAPYRAILSIISAAIAMPTNITADVIVKVTILITLLSFFLINSKLPASLLWRCYPEISVILKKSLS